MKWSSKKRLVEVMKALVVDMNASTYSGPWRKKFAWLPVRIFPYPFNKDTERVSVVWLEFYWTRKIWFCGREFDDNSPAV